MFPSKSSPRTKTPPASPSPQPPRPRQPRRPATGLPPPPPSHGAAPPPTTVPTCSTRPSPTSATTRPPPPARRRQLSRTTLGTPSPRTIPGPPTPASRPTSREGRCTRKTSTSDRDCSINSSLTGFYVKELRLLFSELIIVNSKGLELDCAKNSSSPARFKIFMFPASIFSCVVHIVFMCTHET